MLGGKSSLAPHGYLTPHAHDLICPREHQSQHKHKPLTKIYMTLQVQCLSCSRLFTPTDYDLEVYAKEPLLRLCTACSDALSGYSFDEYMEKTKSLISAL
jgi:choline dehydrogenase-like flavoprotein